MFKLFLLFISVCAADTHIDMITYKGKTKVILEIDGETCEKIIETKDIESEALSVWTEIAGETKCFTIPFKKTDGEERMDIPQRDNTSDDVH